MLRITSEAPPLKNVKDWAPQVLMHSKPGPPARRSGQPTETNFSPALGNPARVTGFRFSPSHGGDPSLSEEVLTQENRPESEGSVV